MLKYDCCAMEFAIGISNPEGLALGGIFGLRGAVVAEGDTGLSEKDVVGDSGPVCLDAFHPKNEENPPPFGLTGLASSTRSCSVS